MKKFYELLFLKQIKGIGNAMVNRKYIPLLHNVNGIEECMELVQKNESQLSEHDITLAKEIAEKKYKEIISMHDIEVITIFDEKYPKRLHDMNNKKPVILYAKGDTDLLKEKSIAIVGTRKPSVWSAKVEENLVKKIHDISEMVIVSGLAMGCDKIAHQTALNANAKTIAVLPSGVNVIVPPMHKKLAQDILAADGCLVSEYEPNATVTKAIYIERDAIVAALTNATFVVECGVKSGTMHTVDFAFDINRPLACYYIDDPAKGQYDGNVYMMEQKNAVKVATTAELQTFLDGVEDV